MVVALASGEAEGFFLPGIIGNLGFGLLCVHQRPGPSTRRWPTPAPRCTGGRSAWYLHPQVRPAYSEITWVWAVYYLAKGSVQLLLVQQGELAALTTARLALGWPGLAALLALTYAYVRGDWQRSAAPTSAYRAALDARRR